MDNLKVRTIADFQSKGETPRNIILINQSHGHTWSSSFGQLLFGLFQMGILQHEHLNYLCKKNIKEYI